MGEPAPPTKEQRIERRRLARAIVESVSNDEEVPLGLIPTRIEGVAMVLLDPVTQLAFELAQELDLLRDELAVIDGNIDSWDWAALARGTSSSNPLRWVARIEAARKESRRG